MGRIVLLVPGGPDSDGAGRGTGTGWGGGGAGVGGPAVAGPTAGRGAAGCGGAAEGPAPAIGFFGGGGGGLRGAAAAPAGVGVGCVAEVAGRAGAGELPGPSSRGRRRVTSETTRAPLSNANNRAKTHSLARAEKAVATAPEPP